MADLEEHEERREQEPERVGDAHRRVVAARAHHASGDHEAQRRNAVTEQQPVEDRRRRQRAADDARIPGEAGSDQDAERGDAPAQRDEVEAHRDERGPDGGERERHGQHAAIEREDQREGGGRDCPGGERTEADPVRVAGPRCAAREEQPGATGECGGKQQGGGRQRERGRALRDAQIGNGETGERCERRSRRVGRRGCERQVAGAQQAPGGEYRDAEAAAMRRA